MQSSFDAASQALADAALACLSPPHDQSDVYPVSSTATSAPSSELSFIATKPAAPSLSPDRCRKSAVGHKPQAAARIKRSNSAYPSLLQYIDKILMDSKHRHNHPPYADQKCASCRQQWDHASIPSTFLPLSPCDHWVHYRCLIWLITRDNWYRDKCPACETQIFEWDGITALTLATRTSLPMDSKQFTVDTPSFHSMVTSDRLEYEGECKLIEELIERRFVTQLSESRELLGSAVDLVQCFNDVINELKAQGRPHAKWLRWSTTTGSLLFGLLVVIKMRRFLMDGYGMITRTEAWTMWDLGCQSLQKNLLEEVHRD